METMVIAFVASSGPSSMVGANIRSVHFLSIVNLVTSVDITISVLGKRICLAGTHMCTEHL